MPLTEDYFIQKCPSCNALIKKKTLQEEQSCGCGFVWEGAVNNIGLRPGSDSQTNFNF